MDLLKRPRRSIIPPTYPRPRTPVGFPAWFAAVALLAGFFPACEREFENPFLPDSEGYAGSAWSRDMDGDGIADSVEKYAPNCSEMPAECLRRAQEKANANLGLETLTAEDMTLHEGGAGLPPRLRWHPPALNITYALEPEDASIAEARNTLVVPKSIGTTTFTVTARGPSGNPRSTTFRVTVVQTRVPVASVSAADLTLASGETKVPQVQVQPGNATDPRYELTTHDPRIAMVRNGALLGGEPGETLVTVRTLDGGHQALFRATVVRKVGVVDPVYIPVQKVKVEEMKFSLVTGLEPRIQEPVIAWTPENASNKAYTLVSEDPAIARVVGGKVEALRNGETKVTLTTHDGAKTAKFKVKVSIFIGCGGVLDPCGEEEED